MLLCCARYNCGKTTLIFPLTTTNVSLRVVYTDAAHSLNSILGMLLRYDCFYGELIGGQNKLF